MIEKKTLKINFNDYVTVNLTKTGAEHLNKLREDFNKHYGFSQKADYAEGEEYSAQMWSLFEDFGEIVSMGNEVPFHGCLMFINTYEKQDF